jgi:predicted dehydrogenase
MADLTPAKVGIVGCGTIAPAYLEAGRFFEQTTIVACADMFPEAAEKRATAFGIKALSVDELFEDPAIEILLNLTPPQQHASTLRRALENGKHAYSEKPLSISTDEAQPLLALAKEKGLRIGCAPDTVLGGGIQTSRKLIDDGQIGTPIGGTAFMYSGGPESWHPNPELFYLKGGGPLFDMGPYYLTTLVNLLGPVDRVFAAGQTTRAQRTIGSGPKKGQLFPVEVPTYIASLLRFESGAAVHFGISFDVVAHNHPPIEIYGSEGCVVVPDPNTFSGNVRLFRKGGWWRDVPHTHGFGERDWRGMGLAEMVQAMRAAVPHRSSAEVAFHVLEVMEAISGVVFAGGDRLVESTCERPRPLAPLPPVYDLG